MRAGAGCVGCVRVCVLVVSGFSTRISHTYGIGLDRIGILTSSWYVRTVRDVLWANYLAIDYESSSYYIYY